MRKYDNEVFDGATNKGGIIFSSSTTVKYWNENPVANEVVIKFTNVTTTFDIAAGFISTKLYKFRKK